MGRDGWDEGHVPGVEVRVGDRVLFLSQRLEQVFGDLLPPGFRDVPFMITLDIDIDGCCL